MTPRDRLVQIAFGEVGEPYEKHRDCSGFTAWAYRQVGVTIPEGSAAQFGVGSAFVGPELLPGDLVFWGYTQADHVGLYVGNGRVINALNERAGIVNSPLGGEYGLPYLGARRVFLPADAMPLGHAPQEPPVSPPDPEPPVRGPRREPEGRTRRRLLRRLVETVRRRRQR